MFSKACEYGIRATLFIASETSEEGKVQLKEIAESIDSPVAFTAKILQQLSKNGIIQSVKGPYGGFSLVKSETTIKLYDIVVAIDGQDIFTGCGLGLNKCDEEFPCPVHDDFKIIRQNLTQLLTNTTVNDLINDISKGNTFLKTLQK